MAKNLFKVVLGILVLSAGYLMLNIASAAFCGSDPVGDGAPAICFADLDVCADLDGCMCEGILIADAATCNFVPPFGGGDGMTSPITYGGYCFDVDGCTCNGFSVLEGEQCLSDGAPTILSTNGQCLDRDGCMCLVDPIAYLANCSAFTAPDITAPVLTAGSVTNTTSQTPSFSFTSSEAGTLSYAGSCSSATVSAVMGANNITFNALVNATYTDCEIRVTDAASNASIRLAVPNFTVNYTPGGGGGGGGGRGSQAMDNCTLPGSTLTGANFEGIDYSPSYYDGECGVAPVGGEEEIIIGSGSLSESENAYLWAYYYGITTMDTYEKADMGGYLIRSHLAKMMSNFAINLGARTPDTSLECDFVDISSQSAELQGYMRLACQLGIMGINTDGTPNTHFNPNDTVDRAQFGTTLSRVIWGDTYNGGNTRYGLHLNALKEANIMTLISQPYQTEIRGYVMIMLMRTYEDGFLNN